MRHQLCLKSVEQIYRDIRQAQRRTRSVSDDQRQVRIRRSELVVGLDLPCSVLGSGYESTRFRAKPGHALIYSDHKKQACVYRFDRLSERERRPKTSAGKGIPSILRVSLTGSVASFNLKNRWVGVSNSETCNPSSIWRI